MRTPNPSVKEIYCFILSPTNLDDESEVPNGDERGQSMIEYGLVLAFISILVLAIFVTMGPSLRDMVTAQATEDEADKREATVSTAIYD